MIKLKALSRAAASAALVLGTSIAPFALTTGVAHAATPYYWAGSNSTITGHTSSTDISAPANWSSTPSTVTAASTGFDAGAQLNFSVSAATTTTGSLSGAPQEVSVTAGAVTVGTTQSSALAIAPGGKLTVVTPSTSGNSLTVGFITDSGALTLDGIKAAQIPAAGSGGVTGPLTLLVSDTLVTTNTGYVYAASDLSGLLGTASSAALKSVDLGKNTSLNVLESDFGNVAQYWTLKTSHVTSFINLTGSVSGTNYLETITGNGGNVKVANTTGKVNVAHITLDADSFAQVTAATDVLASTDFVPNGHSFSRTANTDQGTYPTVASANTGNNAGSAGANGSAGGNAAGAAGGGLTDTAATPAPATPDTGLALVAAHPMTSLIVSAIAAGALFFTARRMKPALRR